jgi:hypothetical protein
MYSTCINGGSGSSGEKENAFGDKGGEGEGEVVGEMDGVEVADLDEDEEAEEWEEE